MIICYWSAWRPSGKVHILSSETLELNSSSLLITGTPFPDKMTPHRIYFLQSWSTPFPEEPDGATPLQSAFNRGQNFVIPQDKRRVIAMATKEVHQLDSASNRTPVVHQHCVKKQMYICEEARCYCVNSQCLSYLININLCNSVNVHLVGQSRADWIQFA